MELVSSGVDIWNSKARPWAIFDERYRQILQEKITRHYWYYEIGSSTPAEFVSTLNTTLFEEMPYFNKLYESTLFKIQPLYNYLLEEDTSTKQLTKRETKDNQEQSLDRESEGNTTGNSNATNSSDVIGTRTYNEDEHKEVETNEIFHDTPEGMLDLSSTDYATNVTYRTGNEDSNVVHDEDTTQNTQGRTNSETTGTENLVWNQILNDVKTGEFFQNVDGIVSKRARGVLNTSQSKLLQDYRDILINIDMQVIDAVSRCFQQVWLL